MSEFDRNSHWSKDGGFGSIEFKKNKSSSKRLINLSLLIFGMTTIFGWYIVSELREYSTSYLMANFFLWGTSLVILVYAFNKRNV